MRERAQSYKEAAAFLKRITYVPGSSFKVNLMPDGLKLVVDLPVIDCDNINQKTTVEGGAFIRFSDLDVGKEGREKLYLEGVHKLLLEGAEHEVNEWLKVDGRKVFDPHKNNGKGLSKCAQQFILHMLERMAEKRSPGKERPAEEEGVGHVVH